LKGLIVSDPFRLPWKLQGGEAAFARVVAFDGEWPANP